MYLGNPNLPKIGSQHEFLVNLDRDGPRSRPNQHPNPRPGQERPPHDFAPVQKLLVAWSQLTATHDVWWSQFIAVLANSWQILDIPADKSSDFINSSNSVVYISFFNRWSHCHYRDFSTDLMDPLVFHISSNPIDTIVLPLKHSGSKLFRLVLPQKLGIFLPGIGYLKNRIYSASYLWEK